MARVLVCTAQVPFSSGGAERHAEGLVREIARLWTRGRTRAPSVQVVPAPRDPDIRARVEASRRVGGGREARGSRDPDEVPLLPREAREQDRLADPPVPPGVRPLRHVPERLHRLARGRALARADRRSGPHGPRGGAEDLHEREEHRRPAGAVQRDRGRGALPSAAARGPVPVRELRGVSRSWPGGSTPGSAWTSRSRRRRPGSSPSSSPETGRIVPRLEDLAAKSGGAVRFAGRVADEDLLALYATSSAVIFPPADEDYGYIALEAFLSKKPVVTCSDSGGPLEFVVDGENGRVVAPDANGARGRGRGVFSRDREKAREFGERGFERVRGISWESCGAGAARGRRNSIERRKRKRRSL